MNDDAALINRFEPVMNSLLPAAGTDEPVTVHAEVLHAICLAEGVLEVLQWSQEGTSTDPLACMWLAGLRWYRLITGSVPGVAPEPSQTPSEHALGMILRSGAVRVTEGTAAAGLKGLASGEMAYPSQPAQPDLTDDGVLLRITPIGLTPYIAETMVTDWTIKAVCLTHGNQQLVDAACERTRTINAGTHPWDRADHQPVKETGLLGVVVEDLGRRWRAATLPQ